MPCVRLLAIPGAETFMISEIIPLLASYSGDKLKVIISLSYLFLFMTTKTVSIKEFRQNLPRICEEIENGTSFLVIRRSKPIGQFGPVKGRDLEAQRETLKFFANPPKKFLFRSKKSAVEIIREDRDSRL